MQVLCLSAIAVSANAVDAAGERTAQPAAAVVSGGIRDTCSHSARHTIATAVNTAILLQNDQLKRHCLTAVMPWHTLCLARPANKPVQPTTTTNCPATSHQLLPALYTLAPLTCPTNHTPSPCFCVAFLHSPHQTGHEGRELLNNKAVSQRTRVGMNIPKLSAQPKGAVQSVGRHLLGEFVFVFMYELHLCWGATQQQCVLALN